MQNLVFRKCKVHVDMMGFPLTEPREMIRYQATDGIGAVVEGFMTPDEAIMLGGHLVRLGTPKVEKAG